MILLDEPSMGLAPQIVEEIFEIVKDLNRKERVSFLLAEQNTNMALRYADYGYILESGRIVMDGEGRALAENDDVKEFYLGVSKEGAQQLSRHQVLSAPQALALVAQVPSRDRRRIAFQQERRHDTSSDRTTTISRPARLRPVKARCSRACRSSWRRAMRACARLGPPA